MRVVEYSESYFRVTSELLLMYFEEVTTDHMVNDDKVKEALNKILASHSVYLLLNDRDRLIGFMTCYLNDEYGMVDPYIVCEYQYILPFHRSGKAIAVLTQALAELCVKLQLPIVNTTYLTASSNSNVQKLGATPLATVSYISLEQATKIYNKYSRRLHK